jgi:patatin-like phospholipase/acyl hydrolase
MTGRYQILTLDGGGMRGIFTAAVISSLEQDLGCRLADHVDLIVGTSTGGIIALGLASGRTGSEMLEFYLSQGPRIFSRPRRLRSPWRPKYSRQRLDQALQDEFGDRVLNDMQRPVCITAHEIVSGTTRVWKDDHSHELTGGGRQLAWKIAAATAAAPTYFAPVQLGSGDSHIDGGVWANNPALVGITEAVRYGGRDLSSIRLLSIGTTSKAFRVRDHQRAERMGWIAWVQEARELLLGGGVSMASDREARLLLGPNAYLRLDSERAADAALDDTAACRGLQEIAEDVARTHRHDVASLLQIDPPTRR